MYKITITFKDGQEKNYLSENYRIDAEEKFLVMFDDFENNITINLLETKIVEVIKQGG
ncbi:MAG: hypothetical protein GF311_28345 [Candidatus Lokiarchaeota archaeon]|nr:hypothetical protein [Candidatus Lokiarchaeota archaeon]